MSNAQRVDRAQLSALEAKALEDRVALLRLQATQGALERGEQAVRRGDNKAVSTELGHYLELAGQSNDPQLYYHLGFARFQLKDFAGATDPFEHFLKLQPQGKLAQAIGYWLGMSYEETNAPAKATEAYQRAAALFPGSELAPTIRQRIRSIAQQQAAAPAAPAARRARRTAAAPSRARRALTRNTSSEAATLGAAALVQPDRARPLLARLSALFSCS